MAFFENLKITKLNFIFQKCFFLTFIGNNLFKITILRLKTHFKFLRICQFCVLPKLRALELRYTLAQQQNVVIFKFMRQIVKNTPKCSP